jgi:hypothetical protein
MDEPERTNTIEICWNQAVAYVVGVLCLVLGPLVFWQYGEGLFGANALAKFLTMCAVGGIVSFGFYAGKRRWFIGSILGLIAGLMVPGLHIFYTAYFAKTEMYDKESALVSLAGAGPCMALLSWILKRDKSAERLTDQQTAGVN